MGISRGKQFEQQFLKDLRKINDSMVYRLPDQQSGYYGTSQNPCDFIFYKYPYFHMIECKSIQGNTFPLSNLHQYSRLIKNIGITGLHIGVVIWFIDHDKILYVPIEEIKKMNANKLKSVNIKMIEDNTYNIIVVPTVKKKIFLEGDYSFLSGLENVI